MKLVLSGSQASKDEIWRSKLIINPSVRVLIFSLFFFFFFCLFVVCFVLFANELLSLCYEGEVTECKSR